MQRELGSEVRNGKLQGSSHSGLSLGFRVWGSGSRV